jgi:hypothetical protein
MRKGGFEPPRACARYHLKVVRLPVSPLSQKFEEVNILKVSTSLQLKKSKPLFFSILTQNPPRQDPPLS